MSTTVNLLLDRLRTVEARYDDLTQQLADPVVVSDSKRYQKTAKAHAELGELVEKFRQYKDLDHGIAETKAMVREETDRGETGARPASRLPRPVSGFLSQLRSCYL